MREKFLPYCRQEVQPEDIAAVTRVLESDWLTTGPTVEAFEQAFAREVGARFAVAFSSGTAALHGAMFAAGVGPGDEVIVPTLTFCASANSAAYLGARPVLAEVDPERLNLDPDRLPLSEATRAVTAVHYAGHPAPLERLRALCDERKLVLVQDACHALGATYRGQPLQSYGDLVCYSFHPAKHITTGEGGMVATDSEEHQRRLKTFRNHGITSEARHRAEKGQFYYEMQVLGYNYRLSDISCALGLSQLGRHHQGLARRRELARAYREALPALVQTPPDDPESGWHLYPVRLDHRDRVAARLREERIGTQVHYIPVHLHPYYQETYGYRAGDFPVAEAAYARLLSLPMFGSMTLEDLEDVVSALRRALA